MYAVALFCTALLDITFAANALVPQSGSGLWADMLLSSSNSNNNITSNQSVYVKPNNASSLLKNSDIKVTCFDDVPDLKPINMANYFEAVQQILIRDDALVPRQFYLGPSPNDKWKWVGGRDSDDEQCLVVLANELPLLTDLFPIILVAHVAAQIAESCITAGKGYKGGYAHPGPHRGVVVVGNTLYS